MPSPCAINTGRSQIDSEVLNDIQTKYGVFRFLNVTKDDFDWSTIRYELVRLEGTFTVFADEINFGDQWTVTVDGPGNWEVHSVDGLSLGALTYAIESSMQDFLAEGDRRCQ